MLLSRGTGAQNKIKNMKACVDGAAHLRTMDEYREVVGAVRESRRHAPRREPAARRDRRRRPFRRGEGVHGARVRAGAVARAKYVFPPPLLKARLTPPRRLRFHAKGGTREKKDVHRTPCVFIYGGTRKCKTEMAKALPTAWGDNYGLEVQIGREPGIPDKMREFNRRHHGCVVFDECHNVAHLEENQDKLQGTYDRIVDFAMTAGGTCKYSHWLWN
eukprot:gene10518-2540_t